MATLATIEKPDRKNLMPMDWYLALRREETKIRLQSQLIQGYRNGLHQDEIFQLAIEAYREASRSRFA